MLLNVNHLQTELSSNSAVLGAASCPCLSLISLVLWRWEGSGVPRPTPQSALWCKKARVGLCSDLAEGYWQTQVCGLPLALCAKMASHCQ